MTYNPNIPLSTDFLSTSQPEIKTNFAQLNTQFAIDHSAFNTGSGNGTGLHKRVSFQNVISDPNQVAPIATLYTKAVTYPSAVVKNEVYYQNTASATDVRQLTSSLFQTYTPAVTGAASFTGFVSNGYYAVVGGVTFFTIKVSWSGASSPLAVVTATLPTTAKATGGSVMFTMPTVGSTGPLIINVGATLVNSNVTLAPGALGFTFSGFYI